VLLSGNYCLYFGSRADTDAATAYGDNNSARHDRRDRVNIHAFICSPGQPDAWNRHVYLALNAGPICHRNTSTNFYAVRDPDTCPQRYTTAIGNGYRNGDANAHSFGNCDGIGNAYRAGRGYTDSYAYGDGYAHRVANFISNRHGNADKYRDGDANANGNRNRNVW
jgi:hypothetical protein